MRQLPVLDSKAFEVQQIDRSELKRVTCNACACATDLVFTEFSTIS